MFIRRKYTKLLEDYMKVLAEYSQACKEVNELRKTCQCRECKWFSERHACYNQKSDNCNKRTSEHESCKQCERR